MPYSIACPISKNLYDCVFIYKVVKKGKIMPLSVNPVNYTNKVLSIKNIGKSANVSFKSEMPDDSFESYSDDRLTVKDKQKILKKACVKATGWSIFGGLFSTAYYALRSDEKIARKFGLDVNKDKFFIFQIKHEQTMSTLIGALPLFGGIIGYIIAKNRNVDNIAVA